MKRTEEEERNEGCKRWVPSCCVRPSQEHLCMDLIFLIQDLNLTAFIMEYFKKMGSQSPDRVQHGVVSMRTTRVRGQRFWLFKMTRPSNCSGRSARRSLQCLHRGYGNAYLELGLGVIHSWTDVTVIWLLISLVRRYHADKVHLPVLRRSWGWDVKDNRLRSTGGFTVGH